MRTKHKWLTFETGTYCLRCLAQRKKGATKLPLNFGNEQKDYVYNKGIMYRAFMLDTFSSTNPECKDFKLSKLIWLIFEPSVQLTEDMELFCADNSIRHKLDFDMGYTGQILLYRPL